MVGCTPGVRETAMVLLAWQMVEGRSLMLQTNTHVVLFNEDERLQRTISFDNVVLLMQTPQNHQV